MNESGRKHLQRTLKKESSCYVLITCGQPAVDGSMNVEMTYEGDADWVSYLLQGAQNCLEQEEEPEFQSCTLHPLNP